MAPDKIDEAVAAANARATSVVDQGAMQGIELHEIPCILSSTGRPASITVPGDLTAEEAGELAAFVLIAVYPSLKQARASKLVGLDGRRLVG